MSLIHRISLAGKALRELGLQSSLQYARYQFGLHLGLFRNIEKPSPVESADFRPLFDLPEPDSLASILGEQGCAGLFAGADEIVDGKVRLFGAGPVPLQLAVPGPLLHWTEYERRDREGAGLSHQGKDIKFVWEPGRFGWAYTLGRAYQLGGDERYAQVFWSHTEAFLSANPPYLGLHWISAQEAALRIFAFAFALHVFRPSPATTSGRRMRLVQAVAEHAARIPPTLSYARAQNNNHLLTEAAGLFTAGCLLPEHPSAPHWLDLGWRWLNHALQTQIAPDGTYIQHSANYHRLMLQTALWTGTISSGLGRPLPAKTLRRLSAATHWLLALLDPESGRLPNLGPNDGAYILPLATCPFEDYRPVLQAAGQAFLGEHPFPPGPWDEMAAYLAERRFAKRHFAEQRSDGEENEGSRSFSIPSWESPPHVLRGPAGVSWAYLRLARFTSRPGHADLLHLDLWWRGLNIVQDAGTYLYNARPPWDNALAHTWVHSTVTVAGKDQMTPAGRFLFLDWAQAWLVDRQQAQDGSWSLLVARQDGYRRMGVVHERAVERRSDHWRVTDRLLSAASPKAGNPREMDSLPAAARKPITCQIHWLLPDWPWEIANHEPSPGVDLRLRSPYGWIALSVEKFLDSPPSSLPSDSASENFAFRTRLARAGQLLVGDGPVSPVSGWVSPTYGQKIPALSLQIEVEGPLPLTLRSTFDLQTLGPVT